MPNFLEKIKKLSENEKAFFLSDRPLFILKKSFGIYRVNSELSEKIASEIGWMYVDEIKLHNLPQIIIQNTGIAQNIAYGIAYELNKRIFNLFPNHFQDAPFLLSQWERLKSPPVLTEDEAWKKVLEIEPWILELEKEERQETQNKKDYDFQKQASFTKLSLSDALKKFPEVGEQLITGNKIKLKNFPEPARPSIKNWLSDYTFNLGYDPHDSITRSSYLFQNENAKILNASDRQKVGYVLKAYDENSEVSVNVNTKQIVFERGENRQPTTYNQQLNQTSETSFAKNTLDSPKDIFENQEENKQKFFDGHTVQGRQWTNLPEGGRDIQPATYNRQPDARAETPMAKNIPGSSRNIFTENKHGAEVPHFDMAQKPEKPIQKTTPPLKTEFPSYEKKEMEFSSPQKMPYENDRQPTTNNLRPTTYDQQQTTNNLQQENNNEQPATSNKQRMDINQQPANVSQQNPPAPEPMRITPSGFNRNTFNHSDNNPQSKNVVNLKE